MCIRDRYESGEIYFEEFLRVQIMELLLLLAREYSQSSETQKAITAYEKYKPMVEQAIRYVDEHYREPLKLEDVCRVSMVSKTYFCYLFKLLTQQTLVEYIMNLRIRKALEPVSYTHLDVYKRQLCAHSPAVTPEVAERFLDGLEAHAVRLGTNPRTGFSKKSNWGVMEYTGLYVIAWILDRPDDLERARFFLKEALHTQIMDDGMQLSLIHI